LGPYEVQKECVFEGCPSSHPSVTNIGDQASCHIYKKLGGGVLQKNSYLPHMGVVKSETMTNIFYFWDIN